MCSRLFFTAIIVIASVIQISAAGYRPVITPVTPNIIKVSYIPEGAAAGSLVEPLTVEPVYNFEAERVKPEFLKKFPGEGYESYVTLSGLTVDDYKNGRLRFYPLSKAADGNVDFLLTTDSPVERDGKLTITFESMRKLDKIYGAGERGYRLNLAGDTLINYNRQNYGYTAGDERIKQMGITMPLVISPDGFAILFDDAAPSEIILDDNRLTFSTEAVDQPITCYVVSSCSILNANREGRLARLTEELTRITGRQELPPLWSLGYITSKYGYRTQDETLGAVDTLKREGYPVDGIVLDLYWYGKEQDMGALSWEKNQWPDHRKMLRQLKDKGVNLIAISQPYVLKNGRGIDNYNELSQRRMLGRDSLGNTHEVKIWVGEGGMFDMSNPDTRKWLRDRYKQLTDEGVTGWWGDLGEPEVHPESMIHANGQSARLYHNRYGNDWSRIIYDLFKDEYPDTRLMTLMRGGTVGLQRYNVFPWSTDVSRSWGGLQAQIPIMINSGLSGLGYMSHDVGGFAVDPENPVDPELYVRWLQLGVFSPILRTHAQQFAEPYKYPEYKSIVLPLIKERYRWLPYNYTLAYENWHNGTPLVRPLGFDTKQSIIDVEDEYMWGRDVLVAPVLSQGATSRRVILPEGEWYDYNDPAVTYNGPDTITCSAPLDRLPLFIRAGAVIPTADYEMSNTGDYNQLDYTLNYYYSDRSSKDCAGYIFEDDMKTPSRGDGLHEYPHRLIKIYCKPNYKDSGNTMISLMTTFVNSSFDAKTCRQKSLTLKVYGMKRPKEVNCGQEKLPFTYDEATRTLTVTGIKYTPGDSDRILIVN